MPSDLAALLAVQGFRCLDRIDRRQCSYLSPSGLVAAANAGSPPSAGVATHALTMPSTPKTVLVIQPASFHPTGRAGSGHPGAPPLAPGLGAAGGGCLRPLPGGGARGQGDAGRPLDLASRGNRRQRRLHWCDCLARLTLQSCLAWRGARRDIGQQPDACSCFTPCRLNHVAAGVLWSLRPTLRARCPHLLTHNI